MGVLISDFEAYNGASRKVCMSEMHPQGHFEPFPFFHLEL